MKSLETLAKEHDTDKLPHKYIAEYACRFDPMRELPITILEIGTWQGASVKMWRDYFPNGKIVGIDWAPEWTPVPEDGILFERGDQTDRTFLKHIGNTYGPFDIIVDDGGHKPNQHIVSFEELFPYVNPGGWYAIEDLHSLFDVCWTQPGERTIMDVIRENDQSILIGGGPIEEVHIVGGCWNDGLVFFRKRHSPYTGRPQ